MQMMTVKTFSKKIKEYIRILKLARRPGKEEFWMVSKIAGVAMLIIGLIGFSIYILMTVIPKGV
ncbi:MAG: protein translocase SEC61 complex subunit gamma [Candidatus Methanospirareceae archaeon]